MISVKDLSFSYGKKRILSGLSFSAGPGECVAIIGSNGSGKSTTLSLITGALKPAAGEIAVTGKIGFIPQGTALFEDMTVEDNLRFFAGLFHAEVPSVLPFDLNKDRKKRVSKLSGGRKKQVSIAAALLGDPENILLDEPAAGLDLVYQQQLIDLLFQLKAAGRTILYVGHNPFEYAAVFDRLVFLGKDGPRYFSRNDFGGNETDIGLVAGRISEYFKSHYDTKEFKEGDIS